MKHNIKLSINNDENSYWKESLDQSNYSVLVKEIDINNKEKFIDEILKEFENTDESLIPLFKEKLTLWLEAMDDNELDIIKEEKLRDFIYEMF